jgi:hypothetical protein
MSRKERKQRRQEAKVAKYMERLLLQAPGIAIVELNLKSREFQFTLELGPPQEFTAVSAPVFFLYSSLEDPYVQKNPT